jgi:uncharacterized protein YjbI with pentapeptide repeats
MVEPFGVEEKFYSELEFLKIEYPERVVQDVEFYKCRFSECYFFKTRFIDCEFENCTFEKCDLSLIALTGSRLLDVEFTDTKILGVDWTLLKKPYRFSFNRCKLDNSSFFRMELNSLNMIECSAREADFIEANLTKMVFAYTDLYHSRFNGANLSFANFSNAINYSIDPNQCKLKKTIFTMPEAMQLLSAFDVVIK